MIFGLVIPRNLLCHNKKSVCKKLGPFLSYDHLAKGRFVHFTPQRVLLAARKGSYTSDYVTGGGDGWCAGTG